MDNPTIYLKPGRERPLLAGHPWLFSGALQAVPPNLAAGEVVEVTTAHGEWVARGYLNPHNSLALRVLTTERDEPVDQAFFVRRVAQAAALRTELLAQGTNAYRLIHAEGDFLPGLIVDRFDQWLVAQFHTAGIERQRDRIVAALGEVMAPRGILLRNDMGVRAREGLSVGAAEVVWGEVPPELTITEAGVRYLVDPYRGQKTGFFLDQRDKRARIRACAAGARSLLNGFAYSGAFALAALAANPALRTVNVDASKAALDLARRNYTLNEHDFDSDVHTFIAEDVGAYLKARSAAGDQFDIVIMDPPAFAKTLENKRRALYGYETLNALAARVVAPGGYLLTCSCTGVVDMGEFEAVVHAALLAARRQAQVVASYTLSLDHPTLPGFAEDRYLKALLLRIVR